MQTQNILIAGFGGQGVLFAGKFLAYTGLLRGDELSWLPSYGPEMRGGTANCSVILSAEPVGSPIVSEPNALIAMNRPSLEKYLPAVVPGGVVLYDSTLIPDAPARADVRILAVPASGIAEREGLNGLANMILVGAFLRERMPEAYALTDAALAKVVPQKKAQMIEANRRAVDIGYAREA